MLIYYSSLCPSFLDALPTILWPRPSLSPKCPILNSLLPPRLPRWLVKDGFWLLSTPTNALESSTLVCHCATWRHPRADWPSDPLQMQPLIDEIVGQRSTNGEPEPGAYRHQRGSGRSPWESCGAVYLAFCVSYISMRNPSHSSHFHPELCHLAFRPSPVSALIFQNSIHALISLPSGWALNHLRLR